ncbi:IclR family transcriptional regulator C-terminal domain-containing protein [Streptomyces sp. ME03-5709C]|nr:IclR family transcriptional regulator C-terminal domain-containing protein [Streptomyces sp. ME03-5709C]
MDSNRWMSRHGVAREADMTPYGTASENVAAQVIHESVRVLDCFSVETPNLHAVDIVRMAGVPSSTVMEILHTLVDQHLLQQDGFFYSVGLRAIEWGAAADAASDLLTAGRPLVRTLRDRSGECCGLQIRRGGNHVTLFSAHSVHTLAYPGYTGRLQPLRDSAAGDIFMAHDLSALRVVLDSGRTSIETGALQCHLERVRRRGWTFVKERRGSDMGVLAAPVFAGNGAVAAAVTLGGPTRRLTTDRVAGLAGQVVECAQDLSHYLAACP